MSKPMYCPMSFAALQPFASTDMANVCTPDCAWATKTNEKYACAIALLGAHDTVMVTINARPLKDDAE